MPIDRITDLIERLGAYPIWGVLLELALIWLAVYAVVRFVQGTRAAGALKALLVIAVLLTLGVRVLGDQESFGRISYLYDRALALVAILLVVVFQPELRRAVIRLGETSLFSGWTSEIGATAREIARACAYLSKAKFGAIIAIERASGLRSLIEDGATKLDAEVSARLLQTIFYPGSALHDLAVVIRGDRVAAAHVQLPLAEPDEMHDPGHGARHRAAVGLTRDADSLVIIVSEESGHIRIAEGGRLSEPIAPKDLEHELIERLGSPPPAPEPHREEQASAMSDEGMVEKPEQPGPPKGERPEKKTEKKTGKKPGKDKGKGTEATA